MKLATSTSDFLHYASSFEEIVELLAQTPFRYLDSGLGMGLLNKFPELLGDNWQDAAKRVRDCAERHGMQFVQAHAPMGRPLVKNEEYEDFIFNTKRAMEIAACLGSKNIVVHSGYREGISKEECFQENKQFYEELFPLAEKLEINILTENFDIMCVPNMYWVDNAKDERELIDYVNHPLFHACWDTGHGNMQQTTQREALNILGEHVYGLHVQDNMGDVDYHLAPYFGTMDIDSLMLGLADIHYDGYFTFETGIVRGESGRRKSEEKSTRAKLPLHLKIQAENLLYNIGEYMIGNG